MPENEQSEDESTSSYQRHAADHLIARSFYQELREHGYATKELLEVAIQLVDLVVRDLGEP